MLYRDVQIAEDQALDDAGSIPIKLDVQAPLTELTVDFELKNGGSDLADEPPEKAISKIEIVDGGKTYWSLTGQEAVAAACFDCKQWPTHRYNETASEMQRITIPIRFGLYLGDPTYAFTPSKLKNPQLKLTWAKASGHLAGSVTAGLWAKVMEDLAAPSSCLMWKGIESFISAAAGDHPVNLPRDYPFRRMLIRAYEADTIPTNIITHLKLTCDVGKFVPFDLPVKDFRYLMQNKFGPFMIKKMDQCTQGDYHQSWMAADGFAAGSTEDINGVFSPWLTGSVNYKTRGPGLSSARCEALIWGYMPHSCFCWQFGDEDTPNDWFNPLQWGGEVLILTQGAVNCVVSVAMQQLVPLP